MDKQKLSTFEAVDRICARFKIPRAAVSFCGLKDKQGRTTQLIAIERRAGRAAGPGPAPEAARPDARAPLSAENTTSNRFAVTVRDLSEDDVARLAASVAEVRRLGVVNYFDSQRFGVAEARPGLHREGPHARRLRGRAPERARPAERARPTRTTRRVKGFWKEHWGEWDRQEPLPGRGAVPGGGEVAAAAPGRLTAARSSGPSRAGARSRSSRTRAGSGTRG